MIGAMRAILHRLAGRPVRDLIVNADDFGLSHGVNRGIITAHRRGIVTSTSLMVRAAAASEAATLARAHPSLSVGLHLDLGEWRYRDGDWIPVYHIVDLSNRARVSTEVILQVAKFHELCGRNPTHLDSHQHVHREDPCVREALMESATKLGVPLRHCSARIQYCGAFYGRHRDDLPAPHLVTPEKLVDIITTLPPGITELACHPAEADDAGSDYGRERPLELAALCDPRVRSALRRAAVRLRSFKGAPAELLERLEGRGEHALVGG